MRLNCDMRNISNAKKNIPNAKKKAIYIENFV